MVDLYTVLGVSRGASEDEIRRAYKRRSLETHPDKGGSNEEFQAVNQAKQVLLDSALRAEYDATGRIPGAAEEAGGGPPMGPNMADIFGSMFGSMGGIPFFAGGGPPPGPTRGPDKVTDIGVSLSDLWHGKTIQLNMKRDTLCSGCAGKGGTGLRPCGPCNGRGFRMNRRQMGPMQMVTQEPCSVCCQSGQEATTVCEECKGRRVVERETVLETKIEPGMQEGDRLVFPNQCSESPHYSMPGNVILVIRPVATDPPEWLRRGADLMIEVRLTLAEAMLGWERTLTGHPSGKPLHIVWTGGALRDAEVLRVVGSGMPIRGANAYGDLRIVCRVDRQGTWTAEQISALKNVWPEWRAPVVTADSITPISVSES